MPLLAVYNKNIEGGHGSDAGNIRNPELYNVAHI